MTDSFLRALVHSLYTELLTFDELQAAYSMLLRASAYHLSKLGPDLWKCGEKGLKIVWNADNEKALEHVQEDKEEATEAAGGVAETQPVGIETLAV